MLITFEGIDGSGKTTVARATQERMRTVFPELEVLRTREPGGWDNGGAMVRRLLLQHDPLQSATELFLFLADRTEHVHRVIKPALKRKALVLCERYSDSTRAYQIWGRGCPRSFLEQAYDTAAFPIPDVTFLLDIPLECAIERIRKRGSPDRMEQERAFLDRVRQGYQSLAREYPERIVVLDGTQPTPTTVGVVEERLVSLTAEDAKGLP